MTGGRKKIQARRGPALKTGGPPTPYPHPTQSLSPPQTTQILATNETLSTPAQNQTLSTHGQNLNSETLSSSEDFPVLPGSSPPLQPVQAQAQSWKDRAAANLSKSFKLNFNPAAKIVEGKLFLPSSIFNDNTKFNSCLVGYTLGKRFTFSFVKKTVETLWGKAGLVKVQSNAEGVFLFHFSTVQECLAVLEAGPWHIVSRPLMLRQWTPMTNMAKINHQCIPIWIRIYNLPLGLWDKEGLEYVCSPFARPLCSDKQTKDRAQIDFARVCVEINTDTIIPEHFKGVNDIGEEVDIYVEVPPLPQKCDYCKVFGHKCSSARQEWQPKPKPPHQPQTQHPPTHNLTHNLATPQTRSEPPSNHPQPDTNHLSPKTLDKQAGKRPVIADNTPKGFDPDVLLKGNLIDLLAAVSKTPSHHASTSRFVEPEQEGNDLLEPTQAGMCSPDEDALVAEVDYLIAKANLGVVVVKDTFDNSFQQQLASPSDPLCPSPGLEDISSGLDGGEPDTPIRICEPSVEEDKEDSWNTVMSKSAKRKLRAQNASASSGSSNSGGSRQLNPRARGSRYKR